jgi:hypothetical protein
LPGLIRRQEPPQIEMGFGQLPDFPRMYSAASA